MSADNWATCPSCKTEEQFREDYEIFMQNNGVICVCYNGKCKKCGVETSFEYFHSDLRNDTK